MKLSYACLWKVHLQENNSRGQDKSFIEQVVSSHLEHTGELYTSILTILYVFLSDGVSMTNVSHRFTCGYSSLTELH